MNPRSGLDRFRRLNPRSLSPAPLHPARCILARCILNRGMPGWSVTGRATAPRSCWCGWLARHDYFLIANRSTSAFATSRIDTRRSMAVRWMNRNASGSVSRSFVINRPLARSITLRASSRWAISVDLVAQRGGLCVPGDRHLDRRQHPFLGERLDDVGHHPGGQCLLDQPGSASAGQHHHRAWCAGG